ncbi:MAG: hypothetical protein K6T61_04700 [Bryobacteraceae bacterium]|nr:hypothetical protein [Bryobacteraceae bacterium]
MRNWMVKGLGVCALLVLVVTGVVAQGSHKVTVPFKFMINNVSYEAGTYYLNPQMGGARIEVRDERQKPMAQLAVLGRLAAKANA